MTLLITGKVNWVASQEALFFINDHEARTRSQHLSVVERVQVDDILWDIFLSESFLSSGDDCKVLGNSSPSRVEVLSLADIVTLKVNKYGS
ncbi:hypothetical protein Tco_1404792 [Tanacetum coccineum]